MQAVSSIVLPDSMQADWEGDCESEGLEKRKQSGFGIDLTMCVHAL